MAPLDALKEALEAPEATVTDAGTVRLLLLLDSMIWAPGGRAGLLRVTAHALVELEGKLVGLHAREVSRGAAVRPTVKDRVTPLLAAVIVAVWSDGMTPLEALKVAVLDP